jgi:hypothetical protein
VLSATRAFIMKMENSTLNVPDRGEIEYHMIATIVTLVDKACGDKSNAVFTMALCLLKDNHDLSIERALALAMAEAKVTAKLIDLV